MELDWQEVLSENLSGLWEAPGVENDPLAVDEYIAVMTLGSKKEGW